MQAEGCLLNEQTVRSLHSLMLQATKSSHLVFSSHWVHMGAELGGCWNQILAN